MDEVSKVLVTTANADINDWRAQQVGPNAIKIFVYQTLKAAIIAKSPMDCAPHGSTALPTPRPTKTES